MSLKLYWGKEERSGMANDRILTPSGKLLFGDVLVVPKDAQGQEVVLNYSSIKEYGAAMDGIEMETLPEENAYPLLIGAGVDVLGLERSGSSPQGIGLKVSPWIKFAGNQTWNDSKPAVKIREDSSFTRIRFHIFMIGEIVT